MQKAYTHTGTSSPQILLLSAHAYMAEVRYLTGFLHILLCASEAGSPKNLSY